MFIQSFFSHPPLCPCVYLSAVSVPSVSPLPWFNAFVHTFLYECLSILLALLWTPCFLSLNATVLSFPVSSSFMIFLNVIILYLHHSLFIAKLTTAHHSTKSVAWAMANGNKYAQQKYKLSCHQCIAYVVRTFKYHLVLQTIAWGPDAMLFNILFYDKYLLTALLSDKIFQFKFWNTQKMQCLACYNIDMIFLANSWVIEYRVQ